MVAPRMQEAGAVGMQTSKVCAFRNVTGRVSETERMLYNFKTTPCGMDAASTSHDHRCCPFFHSERDRRRIVFVSGTDQLRYCPEPCSDQFDDQRICSRGDACGLCHSTAELLYHPDFFRKRLCHQAKRCPRGRYCAFAHSRQELLVPHFSEGEEAQPAEDFIAHKFKTQWCPIGGPHDWENCVYAHTLRDWRRAPILGYSSRPCPQWLQSVSSGTRELAYHERCPRGMACPMAHGAKEQLYHPQFYKTSPCSETNCRRGALCAFTHGPHDLRQPLAIDESAASNLTVREPIPGAEQLLAMHQPTCAMPPRYHALEEPPRGSMRMWGAGGESPTTLPMAEKKTSGSTSRRGRQRRGAAARQAAAAAAKAAEGDAAERSTTASGTTRFSPDGSPLGSSAPSVAGFEMPAAGMPAGDAWARSALEMHSAGDCYAAAATAAATGQQPHFAQWPPYMYQMVPCLQPKSQLIPASMGYAVQPGEANMSVDQFGSMQYGGYAPVVWGSALPPCIVSLPSGQQAVAMPPTRTSLRSTKRGGIPWDRMRTPSSLGEPSPPITPRKVQSPRNVKDPRGPLSICAALDHFPAGSAEGSTVPDGSSSGRVSGSVSDA